ncbi:MAG: hypothetical protein ACRDZT_08270, partial [Acidimicrobiales bacterium]
MGLGGELPEEGGSYIEPGPSTLTRRRGRFTIRQIHLGGPLSPCRSSMQGPGSIASAQFGTLRMQAVQLLGSLERASTSGQYPV